MEMMLNAVVSALSPLKTLSLSLWAVTPAIVTALVLLLVSLWGCYWVRVSVDQVFKMARVDDYARKLGLSTVLYRLGLGPSLTHLTATVISAVVFLAFLLGAAEIIGLTVVPDFLRRVVAHGPAVFGAVLILGGGLYLGEAAGRILFRAADANHVKGAEALMRVTHGLVVVFSSIMALEYLGVNLSILADSMQIIIASIGLGCAIAFGVAFGMAGKETAERWIRDLTPKSRVQANSEPKQRAVR